MALLTLKFVTDVRDFDYEVIEFHGELDQSNLDTTEGQINDLLKNFTRKNLIFDLSDLKFINSEGVGFIVAINLKLAKKKKNLIVCGPQQNVEDIFELIGLPKLLPILATIGDAIGFIKKTK